MPRAEQDQKMENDRRGDAAQAGPEQKRPRTACELARARFPVMSPEELAPLLVPYGDSEDFAAKLRAVLEEHGMAVVEGVLNEGERADLEATWRREISQESAQPRKELPQQEWWVNAWLHAQGETAWRGRLHPRVRRSFECAFGSEDLSVSADMVKNFCVLEGTGASDNEQWLHVDQNSLTGITHRCYQGVLYIWGSGGEDCSTTVVWPGSHRQDGVYGRLLKDPISVEKSSWVDGAGVRFGHYIKFGELKGPEAAQLEGEAVAAARRVPVPAGALLLWDSKTTHQGWAGGRRLALPICWEPRERVSQEARQRKLFMAAAGLPSTHSPSEGRFHPCVATRRGPGSRLRRPAARPFGALPPEALPEEQWQSLWAKWEGEQHVEELCSAWDVASLEAALKPEVAAVL